MLARLSQIGFVVAFCFLSIRAVEAANIFWASEEWPDFGVLDQGFVDLLDGAGHNVETHYSEVEFSFLEPDLIDAMNASDLVIVSRSIQRGYQGWNGRRRTDIHHL